MAIASFNKKIKNLIEFKHNFFFLHTMYLGKKT